MQQSLSCNRRSLFKKAIFALSFWPFVKQRVHASACPSKIPAGHETAQDGQRYGYVSHISKITKDSPDHQKFRPSQSCGNCTWYGDKMGMKKGAPQSFAPCPQMQNKKVSVCGWCNRYTKYKKSQFVIRS